MRNMTQQELDSINTYIDKISVNTEVNFMDILADGEKDTEKKLKEMEGNNETLSKDS